MFKRIICLLLALTLFVMTGCSSADQKEDTESKPNSAEAELAHELQLLYCANDTMNPYRTISKLNAELGLLLFDSLFKYTNNFETVNCLASSASFEDKAFTVTLKDATFSNGSRVTSADVLYSFNLAKESSRFSSYFYEVISVSAPNAEQIVFTLNCIDPYFANLLTFPIIKEGSDKLKNEDNVELVPIGSGRFVFDDKNAVLIKNEGHFEKGGNIEKINLINAPDTESMEHYVEIGASDIYFADLTDDSIIRMDSKKATVNRNNLIYLGINHNYAPLKTDELRFAISSAISRNDIATKAFYANATPATGFLHPAIDAVSAYQSINPNEDKKISVENLAKIGYNKLNSDRYYENERGKIIELTLLVNKSSASKMSCAQLIVDRLADAGIKVTINAVDRAAYFSALENGDFQLYIGEIKLLPNLDMRHMLISGGSAAYGMVEQKLPEETTDNLEGEQDTQTEENEADDSLSEEIPVEPFFDNETAYISVIEGFYSGANAVTDLASSLLSSMPVIPLVYRNSLVFYSGEIEDVYSPSYCDIFISMDKYIVKK